MSRIGKKPIVIDKAVKVAISDKDATILIEGPKGKLSLSIFDGLTVKQDQDKLIVECLSQAKPFKQKHGLLRSLIANMVQGVLKGFKKELEIVGVGYKAQMKGNNLVLNLGFSHPVEMIPPQGIKITVPAPTKVLIEGVDKQAVGQFAAKIRDIYPPEPYKGKGVRYAGEYVRKKLGKAMAKG